jgi:hypothetical protein
MSIAIDSHAPSGRVSNRSGMVAYLVLAHAADEQLRLLTNELLADPRSRVYLHLDAKVFDLDWVEVYGTQRLVVLPNRKMVNWGGYSVVEASILLLQAAVSDLSNQRFVLLSGSCFPLKPISEINDDILALTRPSLAIWGRIDSGLKQGEGLGRYVVTKFYPHDNRFLSPKVSGLSARAWEVYKWINARLPYERKIDLRDLWKGSQFFILDRKCAELCAQAPNELDRALRYALAPDEIIFTTIIARTIISMGETISTVSPSAERQGSHFILKRVPSRRSLQERLFGQVELRRLTPADVAAAIASGALFARKCSPDVSNEIVCQWTHPTAEGG